MSDKDYITVLNGRVKIQQIEGALKTSTDSVMLAAACPAKAQQNVLDLGCGVGSAGFCVLARVAGAQLTGVDIQGDHVSVARDNASLNGMGEHTCFKQDDVSNFDQMIFDHVICNPPYEEAGAYLPSPSDKKDKALGHDDKGALEIWIKSAYRNVKSGGTLTLIHKAERSQDIIRYLGKAWGDLEIIPLFSKQGQVAKRVIIRARKQRRGKTILHVGLVLHQEDGSYTEQAEKILRDAEGLFIKTENKF